MSKLYNMYLKLKEKDHNKLYLFKVGKFYIFLAEDCDTINDYVVLKKTKFSSETQKCGFPENVLEEYLRVFKNHKLDIEVIDNILPKDDREVIGNVKNYLDKIDINKITPIDALEHLAKIKEIIDNEKIS